MENTKFYACGGWYTENENQYFALVKPTKGLPYITNDRKMGERLFNLCKHHSHFYQILIREDKIICLLVESSCCPKVQCLFDIELSGQLKDDVLLVINENLFWSI